MNLVGQLLLNFSAVIWEALPFIVLGVVIAGLLEEFVPQQTFARIIPRNRYLGIALGGVLGTVFPMCECGIIVVMKRLLRKGLPLSVCICYMLAGPIINVVVIISTYVAFDYPTKEVRIFGGPEGVVALRVGLGFIIAFTTALVVDWQYKKHGNALLHRSITHNLGGPDEVPEGTAPEKRTWIKRLDNITETALHDFVDIMAFLVLGAFLAAVGKEILRGTDFEKDIQSSAVLAIGLMMLFAVLLCLCSEADAFVAAAFPPIWPPASKIAFLVLGPMLDLKLYLMYTRVFRPRLIFMIIGCVVSQVFVYALIVHFNYDWIAKTVAAFRKD